MTRETISYHSRLPNDTHTSFHTMANYNGLEWIGDLKALGKLATNITRVSDTDPITYEFRINNGAQHLYGDRIDHGVMLKHLFSDRYAVAVISSLQLANITYLYMTLIPLHNNVYAQIINEEEAFDGEEVMLHNTGRQVTLETGNKAEEIVLLFGSDNGGVPMLLRVNLNKLPNVKREYNWMAMLFVIVFVLGTIIAMAYCYTKTSKITPLNADANHVGRSPFFPDINK